MNTPDLCSEAFVPSRVTERKTALEAKRLEYHSKLRQPLGAPHEHIRDMYQRHDLDEEYRLLYYKFYLLSQVMLAMDKAHKLSATEGEPLDSYTLTAQDLKPDLQAIVGTKFDEDIFIQAAEIIYEKCMGEIPVE